MCRAEADSRSVGPACERQRVGRVETVVGVFGELVVGFGCRFRGGFDSGWSFVAARLNRLVRGKLGVSKPPFP